MLVLYAYIVRVLRFHSFDFPCFVPAVYVSANVFIQGNQNNVIFNKNIYAYVYHMNWDSLVSKFKRVLVSTSQYFRIKLSFRFFV